MREIQDTWAKRAKSEGYRSRAAYKLIEINKKFKLIEQSKLIIELGSAPGGWSQVIGKKKQKSSQCVAIDILAMEHVVNIEFTQCDIFSNDFEELTTSYIGNVDLILSDMSVNLSGIKLVDDESNKELNLKCLDVTKRLLNDDGALLIKAFNNNTFKSVRSEFESYFETVHVEKPPASKTSSAEVYLLGLIPK